LILKAFLDPVVNKIVPTTCMGCHVAEK